MTAPDNHCLPLGLEALEERLLLATWYVAPAADPAEDGSAGHPFDSIQQAIDAAAEGDTVEVAAGTYAGGLTIATQGLRLLPSAGQSVAIQSAGVSDLQIAADGVTVGRSDGGKFVFGGAAATLVALADSLSGVSILGCEFAPAGSDAALDVGNANALLQIIGNTFTAEADGRSITGLTVVSGTFRANRFTSSGQAPVSRAIDLAGAAAGTDLVSNWVQGYGVGVSLGGANGLFASVRDNYFVACGVGLQFVDRGAGGVYSATVYGNAFMGNQTGLLVEAGGHVDPAAIHVYQGNSFTDNGTAIDNGGSGLLAVGPKIGNTVLPTGNGNWFGHRTGPLMDSNPGGKGDKIVGPVDFYGKTWAAVPPLLVPPNVTAALTAAGASRTAIPGDTLSVGVAFTNENDFAVVGQMTVSVYLSADATFDGGDLLVQSTPFAVSLLRDQAVVRQVKVYISTDFIPGNFHLLAVANTGAVLEQAVEGSQELDVAWMFGTLGKRRGAVLTLAGARYSLSGGGYGLVSATGDAGVVDVRLIGTGSSTSISIKPAPKLATWDIRDLTAADPVGSFAAAQTAVLGDVTFSGGVRSLAIGSIQGDTAHTMEIHTGPRLRGTTLALGAVNDLDLTSDLPIVSLSVTSWARTQGASRPNRIAAPSIGSLTSIDEFSADIGSGLAKVAMGQASVRGQGEGGLGLYDSTWWLTGTVQGISLAQAIDCTIYVDVRSDVTGLPTNLSQFTAAGSIRKLTIGSLTNTAIAAANLGAVTIARGAEVPGEVSGLTTRLLRSLTYENNGGRVRLNDLTWPGQSYQDGEFIVRVV